MKELLQYFSNYLKNKELGTRESGDWVAVFSISAVFVSPSREPVVKVWWLPSDPI
jgi:hypothetical protein